MKKTIDLFSALAMAGSLSGCGLMVDAFKAGFIIALILAVIVGLLIWLWHFSWTLVKKYVPAVRAYAKAFNNMETKV